MSTVHPTRRAWQRLAATLVLAACALDAAAAEPLTRYVDPFIGTDGTGHVMPGASMPWGMVAPSPDMATTGWSYTSGYQYRTPTLLGFSNTHISGAGIPGTRRRAAAAGGWQHAGPQAQPTSPASTTRRRRRRIRATTR